MDALKQAGGIIAALIVGAFLWFMGAVFMTGVRLDNFGDIAIFTGWNGLVLGIVIFGIREAIKENEK